jgi:RluA family pseudouridine synthase
MMLSSRISQGFRNIPLLDFLAVRFTYLTKDQWIDRIQEHLVLVNDKQACIDTKLKSGDIVSYTVSDFPEPDADCSYEVVYEDEWIVGINKPGNLLVHKSGASITKNLVYILRHCSGNPAYRSIHSVNRLDRETSGIVLFAKDAACLKLLHKIFAAGHIEKRYLAVVTKPPPEKTMTIELPIGQDLESAVHYKFKVDHEHGKNASTIIETLCACFGHAVLSIRPITGRTHQIRVHCAAIGSPIVGDKLYGMEEKAYLEWRKDPISYRGFLAFKRQALHCNLLSFIHPITGKKLILKAPLPDDMAQLIITLKLKVSD